MATLHTGNFLCTLPPPESPCSSFGALLWILCLLRASACPGPLAPLSDAVRGPLCRPQPGILSLTAFLVGSDLPPSGSGLARLSLLFLGLASQTSRRALGQLQPVLSSGDLPQTQCPGPSRVPATCPPANISPSRIFLSLNSGLLLHQGILLNLICLHLSLLW